MTEQTRENSLLPCFKCGEALENVFTEVANQPYGGTEFRTYGHYGSTFWDSFDGEELVLNICDSCLAKHVERLAVQQSRQMVVLNKKFGVVVGTMRQDSALLSYNDYAGVDPERLVITVEQMGLPKSEEFPHDVEWHSAWEDIKKSALANPEDWR